MNYKCFFVFTLMLFFSSVLFGCSSIQQSRNQAKSERITALQNEWRQKNDQYALSDGQRTFERDYDKVFSSVVTALASMELPVKNMERQSGYIYAEGVNLLTPEKDKELSEGQIKEMNEATGTKWHYKPGNFTYTVTITVSKISTNSTSVKMRLSGIITSAAANANRHNEIYPRKYSEIQRNIWEKIDRQIFLDEHIGK